MSAKGRRLGRWRWHGNKPGNYCRHQAAQRPRECGTARCWRCRSFAYCAAGELSRLSCERLATRDGSWVFLDFLGKRTKVRSVAVPRFKGCATAAMVNSDQTGSSHSSYSLPMSPEKYHQHLHERLLELTEFPSPEALQPNVAENHLGRELSMRRNKASFRPSSREERSFMMDS